MACIRRSRLGASAWYEEGEVTGKKKGWKPSRAVCWVETSAFYRGRVSKWMSSKKDLLPRRGLYPGFKARAVPMPANSCPFAWLHLQALWSLLLRSGCARQLLARCGMAGRTAAPRPTYSQARLKHIRTAPSCRPFAVPEVAHRLQPRLSSKALPK